MATWNTNRGVVVLFVFFILASCINRSEYIYTEIDNQELKNQISMYANYIDSIDSGTEKLLTVVYKKVNDSTVLFDLAYIKLFEPKDSLRKTLSFTFVGNVNNRDVLFFDDASESGIMCRKPYHFFKFKSDNVASDLVDRNFTKDCDDKYLRRSVVVNFDPNHYHLTFTYGKLAKKSVQMGPMFF